jgi:nitroreductase
VCSILEVFRNRYSCRAYKAAPVAFTPLGYPLDAPAAKVRKQLEELVLYR